MDDWSLDIDVVGAEFSNLPSDSSAPSNKGLDDTFGTYFVGNPKFASSRQIGSYFFVLAIKCCPTTVPTAYALLRKLRQVGFIFDRFVISEKEMQFY